MNKKYYEKHKEKIKKNRLIRYYKNRYLELLYAKEYRKKNKRSLKKYYKKWKNKNVLKLKQYKKKYRNENKESIYTSNKLREKRLKSVCILFSKNEWLSMKYSTVGICPACDNFVGIKNITLDHIYPISKAKAGRTYTIKDIQPLCLPCNMKKGTSLY